MEKRKCILCGMQIKIKLFIHSFSSFFLHTVWKVDMLEVCTLFVRANVSI
jgi:hypothetical protein